MLYSTKKLQKTQRYQKYISLRDQYYKLSLHKEQKQQDFLDKISFVNQQTGEVVKKSHAFEKEHKKYTKSIEQKVYAIEEIARNRGLEPIFITLTLPSLYHPFRGVKVRNKHIYVANNTEFEFNTLEDAIKNGYDYLQHIYRVFYKRVKKQIGKELLYIKVVEMHKTLIPHFHILFYTSAENHLLVKKIFDKIVSEFELEQIDFDMFNDTKNGVKTGINRASKYLMKYVTKQLKDEADFFIARLIDGWKKANKIRTITMSNLPLSLGDFRTIYHGIDSKEKEELLKLVKREKVNLFYFLMSNLYTLRIQYKKSGKKVLNNFIKDKLFTLIKVQTRSKTAGGYSYKTDSFTFFIDHKLVYEKIQYKKIYRGNYYEF